jgi:hypothetical protein
MTTNAGYSGTPLVKKLGLKPGMGVRILGAPDGYWELLGGAPAALGVELLAAGGARKATFTHLFATDPAALEEHLERARAGMEEDGLVWASWPKKASGVPSTIGRAEVMAAGKAAGLVDVKVCAVDETWSGLKFVIRVADRAAMTAGRPARR